MDTLLILRHMKVENANAITGLTWGFPAISNFLGYVHALSRKLSGKNGLELEGCGVVCHSRQIQAYRPRRWGKYVFAQTRNPLTKEGETAPFIEEGRMHMTVTLVIPVLGELPEDTDPDDLYRLIEQTALAQRLAGGTVIGIGRVELLEPPENDDDRRNFDRRQMKKLLPGFALAQRSDLLANHTRERLEQDPHADALDAWLDFSALKYQVEQPEGVIDEQSEAEWHMVPKPGGGWLVPMAIGYRAISPLYQPGQVGRTRDNVTPFSFVEAVYSVGEWISPHRVTELNRLIWRYAAQPDAGWYLCQNEYQLLEI